jgi:isoquinoline 1-oxidoreductase alpha subunit
LLVNYFKKSLFVQILFRLLSKFCYLPTSKLNHTIMAAYNIKVNGKSQSVEVDSDTPLLWVLRDELNYVGTKYGCGIGQCGACTVHIDGSAARSCSVTVKQAEGQEITTIEGLSSDGTHVLQEAWREFDVPQCGYCQAGQIMNAAALLKTNPNPTDADIDALMNGNICRCGTYNRIKSAIKSAATKM